jgi:two-component system NtrC family sensor kinase
MTSSIRFGLRAQIVVALSVVFVISFALLGTAAVRLTQAASEVDRVRSARLYAVAFAAALDASRPSERAQVDALLDAWAARTELRAIRIVDRDGRRYQRGSAPAEPGARMRLASGGELTLWLERSRSHTRLAVANLLLFYVSMTGLAVLVLAYFALTHLIVRPLDRLTHSSELLAAGAADVSVPERGAAEVVRLAAAFNAMAAQLRAERDALERRLYELEQTTIELKTAQQQLIHGEKLASVGRLAAGVAHEIGNPLAAILGFVELLRAGDLPPAQGEEFLARIHSETERIHRIIRDLLDFSRRDPDDDLAGQSADLGEVIADAVNLVRPQKASKQVEIQIDVEAGVGHVIGSAQRLTQVLLNLLLNAIDALEGRGCVRIEVRRTSGERCALIVTDDGPGLPQEVLDHLFEPFTTTKPAGKGTGLGLAVCHALVEGMGGEITAKNRAQGGACFEVTLRLSPARPSPA